MNCHYHFEFFEKGFQVKHEKDNLTHQYIPFSSILTIRSEYIHDDKITVITIILKGEMKYSYIFKGREYGEDIYKKIINHL
jgi:hypothetical protein